MHQGENIPFSSCNLPEKGTAGHPPHSKEGHCQGAASARAELGGLLVIWVVVVPRATETSLCYASVQRRQPLPRSGCSLRLCLHQSDLPWWNHTVVAEPMQTL